MAKGTKTGGRQKGSLNVETCRRDEMAKAAAPYFHAKRAPENKDSETVPPTISIGLLECLDAAWLR